MPSDAYTAELGIRPGVYHLGGGRLVRVDACVGGLEHGRRLITKAVPAPVRGNASRHVLVHLAGDERAAVVRALTAVRERTTR